MVIMEFNSLFVKRIIFHNTFYPLYCIIILLIIITINHGKRRKLAIILNLIYRHISLKICYYFCKMLEPLRCILYSRPKLLKLKLLNMLMVIYKAINFVLHLLSSHLSSSFLTSLVGDSIGCLAVTGVCDKQIIISM